MKAKINGMEIEGTPEEIAILLRECKKEIVKENIAKEKPVKENIVKEEPVKERKRRKSFPTKYNWKESWKSVRRNLTTNKDGMTIREMCGTEGIVPAGSAYKIFRSFIKESRGLKKVGGKYFTKENAYLIKHGASRKKKDKRTKYNVNEKLQRTRKKVFERAVQLSKQNDWNMEKGLIRAWAEQKNNYGKLPHGVKRQTEIVPKNSVFNLYPLGERNTKIFVQEIINKILFGEYKLSFLQAKKTYVLKYREWDMKLWENFMSSVCQNKEKLIDAVGYKLNIKIKSESMTLLITKK